MIASIVFCLAAALPACKKNCFCEVKFEDEVLKGYEKVSVMYDSKKKCPDYKYEPWDMLGYTYTCAYED